MHDIALAYGIDRVGLEEGTWDANLWFIRPHVFPVEASLWNARMVWQDVVRIIHFVQTAGPGFEFKPLPYVERRNAWLLRAAGDNRLLFCTTMFGQPEYHEMALLPRMGLFYAADNFRRESFPPDLPMAAG